MSPRLDDGSAGESVEVTSTWYAHTRDRTWTCAPPPSDVWTFHRSLSEYSPTPLIELPTLATELGVGHVFAKDESLRLGLPAFKSLGASWAVHRLVRDLHGDEPITIVSATDGNHGRAIAHWARRLSHRATVVIPSGVHPDAVQAIRDEGAAVVTIEGTYDDAVAMAADLAAGSGRALVQDTAWDGYEEVPGWIVEGYSTMFTETDEQLRASARDRPDLVVVPVGVGSLLQAAITHYRQDSEGPTIASVEPEAASFMATSLAAGRPVTVATGTTIMAGLNCGTPSSLAWPFMARGLDAAIAVGDGDVDAAVRDLSALGVPAGPCGAAGLAGLRVALADDTAHRRHHLGLLPTSAVLLIVTEGVDANPAVAPT